jgi:predicted acyltransferase
MILLDNPGSDEGAYWPIKHAEWNGWTPADLIFPSFLFLVGISLVFSFSSRMEKGDSRRAVWFHVLRRSIILILVGLFVNAMPIYGLDLHTWRFYGVTQRIALCYLVASALELWSGRRGQVIALLACLLGYWALTRFMPVPGFGIPGRDIPFLDPNRNLMAWLDRRLFMGESADLRSCQRTNSATRDPHA